MHDNDHDRGRDLEDMPSFESDADVANEGGAGILDAGMTADDTGTGRHDDRELDPLRSDDEADEGWAGAAQIAEGERGEAAGGAGIPADPTPGIVDYTDRKGPDDGAAGERSPRLDPDREERLGR
jgi:hypothetical protein